VLAPEARSLDQGESLYAFSRLLARNTLDGREDVLDGVGV